MNYEIFKLRFQTGVHIGNGKLADAEATIMADTLFSALCNEAVMLYGDEGVQKLASYVIDNKLRITDAMPVFKDTYYIPKPMVRVDAEKTGDSVLKKEFKKLDYIRLESLGSYLNGTMDPIAERKAIEENKGFGKAEVRTMSSVIDEMNANPFPIGVFRYGEGWGLYFIMAYTEQSIRDFAEELLMSLELSGIGGKRSAGLGKFTLDYAKMPDTLHKKLDTGNPNANHMALSVSMADESELEESLQEAQYSIIKRSGFVASYTYADSFRRKQDYFMFRAGSTFKNTFSGVLQDVSAGGNHKVYRYGKPLFLEVKI